MNAPLNQVLMQIKDDLSLIWLEKIKGDPSKWNKSKYCRFHRDHGHNTDEYYDLKQQIEVLIKQGKLKNFLGQDHKDKRVWRNEGSTNRHYLLTSQGWFLPMTNQLGSKLP